MTIDKNAFGQRLLTWFDEVKRKLPWRNTNNPYAIWISEIMLQQTQVETVIAYYNNLMKEYPTIYELAKADEDEIYSLWQGLGYYSRAKRLIQCAKVIVDQYGGRFPEIYEEIIQLPGIGPYTAGAILSIAFNQKVPAVDGNVFRVISRVLKIEEDITKSRTRTLFEQEVKKLLEEVSSPGDFNQSLMELGAMVCTPLNPKCGYCPVKSYCKAYELKIQETLPIKTKKKPQVRVAMEVAWITFENELLIEKRPTEGLLAGLWGFPMVEKEEGLASGETIKRHLETTYDLKVSNKKQLKSASHIFTHRIWDMKLYLIQVENRQTIEYPQVTWVPLERLNEFPMPTAFKKLIKEH